MSTQSSVKTLIPLRNEGAYATGEKEYLPTGLLNQDEQVSYIFNLTRCIGQSYPF